METGPRVKEATTTTGTGTLTLSGAPTGHRTFLQEVGEGLTCLYWLIDANGIGWETGIGTVTAATLARTTVHRSSAADAALTLSAGTHTVFIAPVPGFQDGDIDCLFSRLTNPIIEAYGESATAPTISAGSLVLDLSLSNNFSVTLTENVTTLTLSNPTTCTSATLYLTQDGTGGRTFAFPASAKFAGGIAPTLTTTAGAIDVLVFVTKDGGTTWLVGLYGANFS